MPTDSAPQETEHIALLAQLETMGDPEYAAGMASYVVAMIARQAREALLGAAPSGEPVAWKIVRSCEGRVVSHFFTDDREMAESIAAGGADASGVTHLSIPLYAGAAPAERGEAEQVVDMLVAAGLVTPEKVEQARGIVRSLDATPREQESPREYEGGDYRNPTRCKSGQDGDCSWEGCPQLRDGEPCATGRQCPLDSEP